MDHEERLLSQRERFHSLAVRIGSMDLDPGNMPWIATLVTCCQGITNVDKEALTDPLYSARVSFARPDIFSRPHSAMAEVCLTYLNCKQVKVLSAYPDD